MIQRLSAQLSEHQAPAAVRGRVLEHLEEERLGEMIGAAGGEEHAARREDAHRAKVDLLVATHRTRQCGSRLREGWWIQHDRVEARTLTLACLEILERIRFDELAVLERIAAKIL